MAEIEVWLSTADAARVLGITTDGVRALVRRGKLVPDARTESGYSLFRRATIEELRDAREQQRKSRSTGGRPPKKAPRRRKSKK